MTAPTGMQLCLAAQARLEAAGIDDGYRDATRLFMAALERSLGDQVKRHHLAAHLTAVASPDLAAEFARKVNESI